MYTDPTFEIKDLEIIGYADKFSHAKVPIRVKPVYRVLGSDQLFLSEKKHEDMLIGSLILNRESDKDFKSRILTRLDMPLTPIRDGMLWVDENMVVHYGPYETENKIIREKGTEHFMQGLSLFLQGNLEESLDHAHYDCAANQQSPAPRALEAAVYTLQDKTCLIPVIRRELRHTKGYPGQFDHLMQSFIDLYKSTRK